jgi:hypothetical protein
LEGASRNGAGFAKEIDYVMHGDVEIEKHLGIQHKIAASVMVGNGLTKPSL